MRILKNKEEHQKYWLNRLKLHDKTYMKEATTIINELNKSYKEAYKQIEKEIAYLFAIQMEQGEMISDIIRTNQFKQTLKQIDKILNNIGAEANKKITNQLAKTYLDNYSNMYEAFNEIGIEGSFEKIPRKQVLEAVKTSWTGGSFSNKIWYNTETLAKKTKVEIVQGLIRGDSLKDMASKLQHLSKGGIFPCERLMRTELNFVINNSNVKSYKEHSIKSYEYMAFIDEDTTDVCLNLDGQIIPLSMAQVGVNRPPMHYFCRSQIRPITEDIKI